MKTLCRVCLITAILLPFVVFAQILPSENLGLSMEIPPEYKNYASEGSYMNPSWVGEVPEWHYYDIFGNKLLDGFYLYGMSMNGTKNSGESSVNLHPFLKKWLNGLVQVGDLSDDHGILVMIGDRVNTRFTPFTYNQSLLCGARFDAFLDFFHGMNSISIINSRISQTGIYGMVTDNGEIEEDADWLHGAHVTKNIEDIVEIGGTFINMHHQEGDQGNSFDGAVNLDSFPENTPTALSIYGVDGRLTLEKQRLTVYSEYARCQEVLGGDFKPEAGNLATVNSRWELLDRINIGTEGYIVQANYKTTFHCPAHKRGDSFGSGNYLYSLVDDNDDLDDYPENGKAKINAVPEGDPDGTIPVTYDKDKNGRFDYEEDFLNFDADPPKSSLYFDKNNNSVPDVVEDDPYPDYPYVPSYYLSGERYLHYDDMAGQWREDTSDGLVSKGLLGFHVNGSYKILPKLDLTLGLVYEESDEESFQLTYQDTTPVELILASEKATTLYSLIRYQKDFAGDRKLTVDNYIRYVKDNIPNHTQNFIYETLGMENTPAEYVTVPDQLDYRDAVVEMLIAEYSMYKNRGFSFATRGKVEFRKNLAHLNFNYPEETIYSLFLVNKCKYIYLLPFKKDMFLIPKYKNLYEFSDYGPRSDLLDFKYRRHTMINAAYLVYEWKMSQKTAITMGLQGSAFNDLNNSSESYLHGNWTIQLLMKDRYSGLNMILTTGFTKYNYEFYTTDKGTAHNPLNNPHRITDDISSYNVFIKVHCGF